MIEAVALLAGFVLLFAVLYGALARDERDNMRGGCKAAAIRALNEAD